MGRHSVAVAKVYIYSLNEIPIGSKVVVPVGTTLPSLYIVLYVVDFVLVLNIKSINNNQGNLNMWPYWTVFRYMQVTLYALFLMRTIRLPFIDRDLLYRDHQQYFSYIMELSFTGGGRQSTGRKPPICHMSLTNFIT